jgi:hypothetical protein
MLGEPEALVRLRDRLHLRGLKLMLDFVPNHTAPDHPWVQEHPDYYIFGTEEQLAQQPQNYILLDLPQGPAIFAYGRDPYFDGWPDTLQLNYGNPGLQTALVNELSGIAGYCDGLRCDMAMLVLPDIFQRTWGINTEAFWPMAIQKVKGQHPDFVFMAEVYWDLEWTLQQQDSITPMTNFFTTGYAIKLPRRCVSHFCRFGLSQKSARFLENHDEPRACYDFSMPSSQSRGCVNLLQPWFALFSPGAIARMAEKSFRPSVSWSGSAD